MTVWKTASVEDQPSLTLHHWRIFENPNGDRFFNGYCYENREGRVSTAIEEFDLTRMRGRTRSGRVYELAGPNGSNGDANYVLTRWLGLHGLTYDDISFVDMM